MSEDQCSLMIEFNESSSDYFRCIVRDFDAQEEGMGLKKLGGLFADQIGVACLGKAYAPGKIQLRGDIESNPNICLIASFSRAYYADLTERARLQNMKIKHFVAETISRRFELSNHRGGGINCTVYEHPGNQPA